MAQSSDALPHRHYLLGGLSIRSTVPLPAFESPSPHFDVLIRPQHIPEDSGGWSHQARRFKASPGRWLFSAPDGSRFLVSDGREVFYDAPPTVAPLELAGHLLQPVLATILHQRDLLALHASAVEIDGGAIVFMGPPGAGKSTLAAWMRARGHAFIADDVCPVDVRSQPTIIGGFKYQKLTSGAAHDVGAGGDATPIPGDDRGRVRVRARDQPAAAQPLARAYVLRTGARGSHGQGASIVGITGPAAVRALVEHTYRRQYLRGLGRLGEHLRACIRVVRDVPLREVFYDHDTCDVHELGAAILEDLHHQE